jgi:phosphocarrier protein
MAECSVQIVNRDGLHARPAAQIAKLTSKFQSEITITREGTEVNAKSIMGVMMLAAERGATLELRAEGADADDALQALKQLIASGFGEP